VFTDFWEWLPQASEQKERIQVDGQIHLSFVAVHPANLVRSGDPGLEETSVCPVFFQDEERLRRDCHAVLGERRPGLGRIIHIWRQLRVVELGIHLGIVAIISAIVAPHPRGFHVGYQIGARARGCVVPPRPLRQT